MANFHEKFSLPARYQPQEKNIWVEYFDLARKYNPVDLGGGYPDFPPPQYVKNALLEVAGSSNDSLHQYTRGAGHPRFVSALSKLYSKLIGREINPYNEIIATLGGYHALFLTIMGVVDQGDEVIIIEPFFECFEKNVKIAGGVPRFIPLELRENLKTGPTSSDWILDFNLLESLFNEKTKAIIINTPHNPLGKVFNYEELNRIADLCKKWNVLCISDEVYQFLVYGGKTHVRIASLPGMWDRTITICSAGKAFGVTGWKLGWAYGPSHLISNLQVVHCNCVRAGNTFLQEAAAICLEKELSRLGTDDSYFVSLAKELEVKRNYVAGILTEAGLTPILPDGGYFIVADWSKLEQNVDLSKEEDKHKDYKFTKWLTKNVGVQGIPVSAFFSQEDKRIGEKFVRFCFVKTDAHLDRAAQAFKLWKPQ